MFKLKLVEGPRHGFHIHCVLDGVDSIVGTCQVADTGYHGSETCFTMQVLELEAGSELFVQEMSKNHGVANQGGTANFGLIKIDDIRS